MGACGSERIGGKNAMTLQVSVIIPMYNARKTLALPLESLARQDFPADDLEAVIVDDGSSDGSAEVARKHLEGAPFEWRVLEAPHGGVSAARNLGIEGSGGECILFLDADDELPPEFLSLLHGGIEKKGAVLGWAWKVPDLGGIKELEKHPLCSRETGIACLEAYLKTPRNAQVMVKKNFLDAFGIRFKEGLAYAEDMDFFVRLLFYAERVHVETETGYLYRKNPGQVTRTIDRIAARKAVDETFRQLTGWLMERKAPFPILLEMKKLEARARINLLREAFKRNERPLFHELMKSAETQETLLLANEGMLSGKWVLRFLLLRLADRFFH